MSIYPIANPGQNTTLQSAATTGNGTVVMCSPNVQEHTIYIRGNGTVSTGAIQLETASDPAYNGTWAPLGSPVTVTVAENVLNVTGKLDALRARVSTTVTGSGGSVDVYYNGN